MPSGSSLFHSHDFSTASVREIYRWMVSAIVPRPIAFVTTISPEGVINLAPFSFFNGISSQPPCLVFSIARKPDGSAKDTLKNLEANGEFVVNSTEEHIVQQANAASADYPYGVDEMALIGLHPLPSTWIKPPRVAESSLQFECRVEKLVPIGEAQAGGATLVIGKVLGLHVSDAVLADGKISYEKLRPVARLGAQEWLKGGEVFSLVRPRA